METVILDYHDKRGIRNYRIRFRKFTDNSYVLESYTPRSWQQVVIPIEDVPKLISQMLVYYTDIEGNERQDGN